MKSSDDQLIRLIAIFKFLKAGLLIALGIGVLKLVHKDLASVIEHWGDALRLDPANRFLDAALEKAVNVSPAQIKKLGLGSFIYAGLFLAEGTGLWMRKRWGELLTVVITTSLIPFEVYEICRHSSYVKLAVLALNIGIVAYLIYRLRTQRSRG
ncbi:MAG: hypothetical protein JWQ87_60 [Candidatus Sulfotelmatobacter sp.]|nr:hypothetical protein [Candidatus Sulfotelmatobacter sp.]